MIALSFRRWALRYEARLLLARIYVAGWWAPLVRVTKTRRLIVLEALPT